MVIPRAFSSGSLSIWSYAVNVAPPDSARTLVIAAVSDVLPWSTWPIVPMLQCGLVRSNFALAIVLSVDPATDLERLNRCLPAVVAEGLVGLGHPMGVLALLHGRPAVVDRVVQLVGKPLLHRMLAALAGGVDDPADRQSLAALGPNFDGYLIGGTADAP